MNGELVGGWTSSREMFDNGGTAEARSSSLNPPNRFRNFRLPASRSKSPPMNIEGVALNWRGVP